MTDRRRQLQRSFAPNNYNLFGEVFDKDRIELTIIVSKKYFPLMYNLVFVAQGSIFIPI